MWVAATGAQTQGCWLVRLPLGTAGLSPTGFPELVRVRVPGPAALPGSVPLLVPPGPQCRHVAQCAYP